MEEKQTIFEDLKKIKGYILGVIAFATAVSVFFTQVLNLPIQPVLATMFIVTIFMLFIGFLIEKSEKRQRIALQKQEEKSVARVESFKESINEIKDNVTLDSEKKIQSVRKAYNKCTDRAKKYINNYEDLVKSEETLSTLKVENVINVS